MSNQPIGVFDSGIGGTSILKEIVKLLPHEHFIYLGDSANAPYGQKSPDQIIALCKKNTDWLLAKGCKLIVVACNTATTNAISFLRENYQVPFIGIEPAIKPAAFQSLTHTIGVLATKGTLSSNLFIQTSEKYADTTKIVEVVGKGLAEHVEAGDFSSDCLKKRLLGFLEPLIAQNIDYLVLGCSHYPYLLPVLRELLPSNITIIDSGEAVAKQTKEVLQENFLLINSQQKPRLQLYTNSPTKILQLISKIHFSNKKVHFSDSF